MPSSSLASRSIPPLGQLNHLFDNEKNCINFLIDKGVFQRESPCESCGELMILREDKWLFRCQKNECSVSSSIRKGSFFYGHKIKCSKILHLAYMWLNNLPTKSIIQMSGMSSKTVCAFLNYFRQLVSDAVEIEDVTIGGEGIIVEIDETKLGKRKYNRGHRVDGVWVLGGVERTPERKVFLVEVKDRKADLLLHVIKKHVLPGSIIHTDLWKGYNSLATSNEYQHFTVNHSKNYKDPLTGTHTNTIEGTWNGLKMQIKPRNRSREFIEEYMWEFIWRRRNRDRLWDGFIEALKEVYYE